MKDAYYFSHDANARNDEKILQVRAAYGTAGYAWYFMLIEMLREASDFKLSLSGKYAYQGHARQLECDPEECRVFIDDCINEFHLFENDGDFFWSKSLINRMQKSKEKSRQASEAAQKRWKETNKKDKKNEAKKCGRNADAMRTHMRTQCENHADAMQLKESKAKQSKAKEIKQKESSSSSIIPSSEKTELKEPPPLFLNDDELQEVIEMRLSRNPVKTNRASYKSWLKSAIATGQVEIKDLRLELETWKKTKQNQTEKQEKQEVENFKQLQETNLQKHLAAHIKDLPEDEHSKLEKQAHAALLIEHGENNQFALTPKVIEFEMIKILKNKLHKEIQFN